MDGRPIVNGSEFEILSNVDKASAVTIYWMASLVADEASRSGFRDFAKNMEALIGGFLSGMPRDEQRQALRLSYEMAAGGEEPARPRLRLVYSRA
jgi:hypothetical protein